MRIPSDPISKPTAFRLLPSSPEGRLRFLIPSLGSLQGAKTGPLNGQWRHGAMPVRLTFDLGAGQTYPGEHRWILEWKFPLIHTQGRQLRSG